MMPRQNRSNPGYGFGQPRYPGTFLLALREAFTRVEWRAQRWLGDAVECTDATGREHILGLENLFRRVRPVDRSAWPDLLAEFLAQVPDEALVDPPGALGEVAERILVRLGPAFAIHDPPGDVWSQRIAGALVVATLVVDYPNSMSYVTNQMIADSGHDGMHWLERALRNLSDRTPEKSLVEVHEESGLLQCDVGDAYDSSRALLLDSMYPGHEVDGFFAAVPGRDHLFVLPVSALALGFLPWLRSIAIRTHRNLPYPISAEVFWIRAGVWHHFPIEVQGDKAIVNPPPEFVEVIARIAPSLPEEPPESAGESSLPS